MGHIKRLHSKIAPIRKFELRLIKPQELLNRCPHGSFIFRRSETSYIPNRDMPALRYEKKKQIWVVVKIPYIYICISYSQSSILLHFIATPFDHHTT